MDADGVLLNAQDGMTPEEIEDHFGIDAADARILIAFAASRGLKKTA